jgi:hypothetical protein
MPVPAGKSVPQNEHFLGLGIRVFPFGCLQSLSCDFLGFTLGFPEHEHVLNSNWTLDVSRNDAPFVLSFQNANSDLGYFASHACPSDDLDDF